MNGLLLNKADEDLYEKEVWMMHMNRNKSVALCGHIYSKDRIDTTNKPYVAVRCSDCENECRKLGLNIPSNW